MVMSGRDWYYDMVHRKIIKEKSRLTDEVDRMRPVYEAAMAYSASGDPDDWDVLMQRCREAASREGS